MLALCGSAYAQYGTTPKPKPADYPVQARAGDLTIAAEYLLHSLPTPNQSFVVPEHLVIEIAVYPSRPQPFEISSGMFTLRVNGKKDELHAQAPEMVAASLKYSDWNSRRNLQVGAGPVIFGGPQATERFPGDRRPTENRLPQPPKAPTETPGGVERPEPETAAEAVVESAFPDGKATGPVSGYLYFEFKKKPKSIKSLELIYHHGQEHTPIQLF
jgi:hypothetical protein